MPPHPLRRISTGSLSSLARSTDRTHAPSDLDFLEPALVELVDEAATLHSNVQRLNKLHDALGTFNEGFAAYLYALKMNAFAIAWPEAPYTPTWQRLSDLAPPPPPAEPQPALASSTSSASSQRASSPAPAGDMTYATVYSDSERPGASKGKSRAPGAATKKAAATGTATGIKKPATVAAKPNAAERRAALAAKKRRDIEISRIIDTQLPLEYRGNDADARLCMERVIERLWDGESLAIADMVKPPEMPHPRVNKCLIALVAKKLVGKSLGKGRTLYTWVGQ